MGSIAGTALPQLMQRAEHRRAGGGNFGQTPPGMMQAMRGATMGAQQARPAGDLSQLYQSIQARSGGGMQPPMNGMRPSGATPMNSAQTGGGKGVSPTPPPMSDHQRHLAHLRHLRQG